MIEDKRPPGTFSDKLSSSSVSLDSIASSGIGASTLSLGPPRSRPSGQMSSRPTDSPSILPFHDVALTTAFIEDVRPLLDFVDSLHSLGLGEYSQISLPRIVIVGDQSSGKSSVVEALSGICLPRGNGIVTRAPLELRMIRNSTIDFLAKLSYKKNGEQKGWDIPNPNEVDDRIREAQNDLTGDSMAVSNVEIKLEVSAPSVPDLTVVDLPGIVRVAADDQSPDIDDQIKALIKSYIEQPNTIILVVCPANVDVANVEAIKFAKSVDPDGERTLGVVTKPDLVDKGSESTVINLVNNQSSIKLSGSSPWIMIKCRSQEDINEGMLLEQAVLQETQYFDSHKHYRHVAKNKRGLKNLATKLTKSLIGKIKTSLPGLREQLNDTIQHLNDELLDLGEGPPDNVNELKIYFVKVLNSFCDRLRSECLGDYHRFSNSVKLLMKTRRMFDELARKIDEKRPDTADHPQPTGADAPAVAAPDAASTAVAPSSKDEELLNTLKRDMNEMRGRELLPYVKFSVFEANIREFVGACRVPIMECLQQVYQLIDLEFQQLAHERLEVFPEMEKTVRDIITKLCKEALSECKASLEEYMDMEDMIYTQDNIYDQEVQMVAGVLRMPADPESNPTPDSTGLTLAKVEVLSPDSDIWCRNEARKHLLNIKAYFRVSSRRMMEIVPMKILYIMLRKLSFNVQNQVTSITSTASDEEIRSMSEDPRIGAEREKLREKIREMENCRKQLDGWSTGVSVSL